MFFHNPMTHMFKNNDIKNIESECANTGWFRQIDVSKCWKLMLSKKNNAHKGSKMMNYKHQHLIAKKLVACPKTNSKKVVDWSSQKCLYANVERWWYQKIGICLQKSIMLIPNPSAQKLTFDALEKFTYDNNERWWSHQIKVWWCRGPLFHRALRSWVVRETWVLGPFIPRMHASPQTLWTVSTCGVKAGRPQTRSATVWDSLLGPTWLIGCWPPA